VKANCARANTTASQPSNMASIHRYRPPLYRAYGCVGTIQADGVVQWKEGCHLWKAVSPAANKERPEQGHSIRVAAGIGN
jgi:hypothetical protein